MNIEQEVEIGLVSAGEGHEVVGVHELDAGRHPMGIDIDVYAVLHLDRLHDVAGDAKSM